MFQERNLVIFLKDICPKSNFRRYVLTFIRTNKRELSLFILYFLFIGFQLGILPLALLSMVTNSDLIHSEFVVFAVNLCIPSIIGIILFRKEIIESFSYFKEKTWLRIASIFFWVGLIFLVDVFTQYILGPTNQSANQEYLSQLGKQTPLFLTLIVFTFFGPILEELIFRHLLINWLSQSVGLILSSLISIFLFTFIHVTHPIDFFMYAPGAILLTIAYLTANRSLVFIIVIHILNNVLGFVL